MTEQLELLLDWRTLKVEDCSHKSLRYGGMMLDEFPLVTCYHPRQPHCGGTFDARKFTRNGALLHEGQLYLAEQLRTWYGK